MRMILCFSSPASIEDFWKFVQKYQAILQKRGPQAISKRVDNDSDKQRSSILNLPLVYEKRHRFNLNVRIPESMTKYEPKYDATGAILIDRQRLSAKRLVEFRSIIEYYLDFNQKEKVNRFLLDRKLFFICFLFLQSSNEF